MLRRSSAWFAGRPRSSVGLSEAVTKQAQALLAQGMSFKDARNELAKKGLLDEAVAPTPTRFRALLNQAAVGSKNSVNPEVLKSVDTCHIAYSYYTELVRYRDGLTSDDDKAKLREDVEAAEARLHAATEHARSLGVPDGETQQSVSSRKLVGITTSVRLLGRSRLGSSSPA